MSSELMVPLNCIVPLLFVFEFGLRLCRFFIPASVPKPSGLTPFASALFDGAQQYGFYVCDTSDSIDFPCVNSVSYTSRLA